MQREDSLVQMLIVDWGALVDTTEREPLKENVYGMSPGQSYVFGARSTRRLRRRPNVASLYRLAKDRLKSLH